MTELAEMIAFGSVDEINWNCPFSHTKNKPKQLNNVMPPVDGEKTNDADKLGKNLKNEYAKHATLDIQIKKGNVINIYKVQYTPHHLIPGNESWPETALLRWVDSRDGHISGDIGYDINHATNGVDLPGIHGVGDTAWSGMTEDFQTKYAFAAMLATRPRRQFHDRHPKYSSFVVNVLDAIAQKLDKSTHGTTPGCGKADCGGKKQAPPYDPPFNLINRINAVAERLENHLKGAPSGWRMPIFTSRFSLMLKKQDKSLTQDEARKEISSFVV